jgi:hypothetical protein
MAKVERRKETITITAEENTVLRRALNILTDIYNDCEDTDGDAYKYTKDAVEELEYFFTDLSDDGTLIIEEPKNDNCCVLIKMEI